MRQLEYRIHQYLPDAPPPDPETEEETTPERPGLGYVPLAVMALVFAGLYLVERYVLQTASPRNQHNDTSLIFVLIITFLAVRTICRWRKAHREYRQSTVSPQEKQK